MVEAFWIALWFAIGAIPFGYVVGRIKFGTDLRQHGSQNIGATNAARTFGMKVGIVILILDAFKGFGAVTATQLVFGHDPLIAGLVGTVAVLGHVFSPFLRFRGGKGVATGLGAIIALNGWAAVLALLAFLLAVLATRIVSLGSLIGIIVAVSTLAVNHEMITVWSFGLPVVAVILWAHRKNWARLLQGKEPRFGGSPKKSNK